MNKGAQKPIPEASGAEQVALVMDLGGNWIRVAHVGVDGGILWRERAPSYALGSGPEVIARIEAVVDRGISQLGGRNVAGIGLALASPVDPNTGIMYSPPNLPGLDGVSFKSLWKDKVEWPILVANDATLAALGEYSYGAGVGARALVYMTISTGIGGGVVIDGVPMMGAYGMAGELGHMIVDPAGLSCKCGGTGCLEAIASGTAIADTARRAAREKRASAMVDMVSGDLDRISTEVVFKAAIAGDTVARDVLDTAAQAIGAGLVNVLHIFNPDVIVIGGGVSNNWDYLWPSVQSYIAGHAMSHVQERGFRVVVSPLGDDAGLVGAAALVWQNAA